MNRLARTQVGAAVAVVVLGLVLAAGCNRTAKPGRGGRTAEQVEDPLVAARDVLAKAKDLDANTCRSALQQINLHLAEHPEWKAPALTPEQRRLLTETFGLEPPELDEVESGIY